MLLISCSLLLVAVFHSVNSQSDSDCGNALNSCEDIAGIKFDIMRFFYVETRKIPSKEFFDENCDKMKVYFDCGADHIGQCSDDDKKHFELKGNAVKELCDQSSEIRRVYMENVGCINENMESILACEDKVKDFTETEFGPNHKLSKEQQKLKRCLRHHANQEVCNFGILRKKCNEEIYEYGLKLYEIIDEETAQHYPQEMIDQMQEKYGKEIGSWEF